MQWLWIPAVALVGLFVAVLCWVFFKDYTCCPCRKKRIPQDEPSVLPTHAQTRSSFIINIHSPSMPSPQPHRLLPTQPRPLPPTRPRPLPPTRPQKPPPKRFSITRPHEEPPLPPAKPHGYVISPTGSPNLHFRYGDLRVSKVVRKVGTIPILDLHGMTVKEATHITETFLDQSLGRDRRVRIITGRGLHSEGGVPKLKPAVESLLEASGYTFREMSRGGCYEVTMPI